MIQSIGSTGNPHLTEVKNKEKVSTVPVPPPYPSEKDWPRDLRGLSGRLAHYALTKNLERKPPLENVSKEEIEILCKAMQQGRFQNPIFANHEHYPFIALAAVKEGILGVSEFATLMIRRLIFMRHVCPIEIPLFIEGKINPLAKEIILKTLIPCTRKPQVAEQYTPDTLFLNEEKLELFFAKMKEKPLSEQRFWHVVDDHYLQDNGSLDEITAFNDTKLDRRTISQEIQLNGFNVFARFRDASNQARRMVPTASMMETYLAVKYGEKSLKINFVIGLSPLEAIIKNALLMTREMALPFPGVTLPEKADLIRAPDFDFIWHDFYHAQLQAAIPENHRLALVTLSQKIEELASRPEFSRYAPFLIAWRETLIDMEAPLYQPYIRASNSKTGKVNQDFWNFVQTSILVTKVRSYTKKVLQKGYLNYLGNTEAQEIFDRPKEMAAINALMQDLIKIKDHWEELTEIPMKSLQDYTQFLLEVLKKKAETTFDFIINKSFYGEEAALENLTHTIAIFDWGKMLK